MGTLRSGNCVEAQNNVKGKPAAPGPPVPPGADASGRLQHRRRLALELAHHQGGYRVGRPAPLEEDGVRLREDRGVDPPLRAKAGERPGGLVALDDRLAAREQLGDLAPLAYLLPELPVAAPQPVAGGHEVPEAAQAVEGLPARPERGADAHHLG